MTRPNILYIHSHDTGRMIRPYGHNIPTPNLQKLAETGVLFRQNFCITPTCSPSRGALLTGCYPHENGLAGLVHRGWRLNNYGQHLVHTLKRAGYQTVLTGVQHVAVDTAVTPAWQTIGYDSFLEGSPEQEAADFLKSKPEEPFFLAVGFFEAHREFPAEVEETAVNHTMPPPPLPDTPETRLDFARYKASVAVLDRKMGQVLDGLAQSGVADNTLVICTTDHGIAFPRMKCHLHDSGVGTMLIMRGPGGFAGGKVIDAMTSHLDIFPTVCDLLEIEHPSWLRGRSLLPLMWEDTAVLHNHLFFELNYHAAYEPVRAVRTPRWKYIRRFDVYPYPVLPNVDDSLSKSVWLAQGWDQRPLPPESLFDLSFDPTETNNLAEDDAHGDILSELRDRLERWMVEMDDPLRHGRLPAPKGGVVNRVDGRSPKEPTHPA